MKKLLIALILVMYSSIAFSACTPAWICVGNSRCYQNYNCGYDYCFYCQNGCYNGTCISENITTTTTMPSKCRETDNGKNYYVKGTCYPPAELGTIAVDHCYSEEILTEYYCSPQGCISENYKCPEKFMCKDGACKYINSSVVVLSPNGREEWEIGKTYEIQWNVSYPPLPTNTTVCTSIGRTTIELYKKEKLYKEIFFTFSSMNNYSWTVPSDIPAGNDYKIKVSVIVPPCDLISDQSDYYFSIINPCEKECVSKGYKTGQCYPEIGFPEIPPSCPTKMPVDIGQNGCYKNQKCCCYPGPVPNISCTDTDDGINSNTKGTCIGKNGNFTDYCSSLGVLGEYYCDNSGYCRHVSYACPPGQGCKDGACVSLPVTTTTTTITTTTTTTTTVGVHIYCPNCTVGSCKCSIQGCSSGYIHIYKTKCIGIPESVISFSQPSFVWSPNSSGTFYLEVLCDNGQKSSCTPVNVIGLKGQFTSTGFACVPILGGHRCTLSYNNQLGENVIVLFLYTDSKGRVISAPAPIATQGLGSVASVFYCNNVQPGSYNVFWKAYRESDQSLINEVAWSKTNEVQEVKC